MKSFRNSSMSKLEMEGKFKDLKSQTKKFEIRYADVHSFIVLVHRH